MEDTSTRRLGSAEAILQLPKTLQALLTVERFHLHNTQYFQNTSGDPAFDRRYLPQNCDALTLPCFWITRKYLFAYGGRARLTSEVVSLEGWTTNEKVLFVSHPLSLPAYASLLSRVGATDASSDDVCILGVPTSSTRTFLAWPNGVPEQACFVKTSLHSPAFGDRRLHIRKIASSVGLSKLVQLSSTQLPRNLRFFLEPFGVVPRQMTDSGMIVRSIPEDFKAGHVTAAPLFALLEPESGYGRPLLLTILDRSRMDLDAFVSEILCAQFARVWLDMSMRLGLILEAHGQDLMLELSPSLSLTGRFFYRDFEGMQVDWELRGWRGLVTPDMPRQCDWFETYETWGYNFSQLIWYKWYLSLFNYLHFVLNELDLAIRDWQSRGLLSSSAANLERSTMTFSRCMFAAIGELFGTRATGAYDIYHSLMPFLNLLLSLRRQLRSNRHRLPG